MNPKLKGIFDQRRMFSGSTRRGHTFLKKAKKPVFRGSFVQVFLGTHYAHVEQKAHSLASFFFGRAMRLTRARLSSPWRHTAEKKKKQLSGKKQIDRNATIAFFLAIGPAPRPGPAK